MSIKDGFYGSLTSPGMSAGSQTFVLSKSREKRAPIAAKVQRKMLSPSGIEFIIKYDCYAG